MKKTIFLLFVTYTFCINAQNKEKTSISLMAVGDIMMGTSFPNRSYLPAKNINPFAKVNAVFHEADILFGNHEGTLTDSGKNAKHCKDPSKCYSFKSPTYLAQYLNAAGFDLMSIANNHIGDFGKIGIKNTKKTFIPTMPQNQLLSDFSMSFFLELKALYNSPAFAPSKRLLIFS